MNAKLRNSLRLQHQIDPKNESLCSKFEKKIPLCTSYIVASLQYQTKIANYHLQAMEMCLSLFNTASDGMMKTVANLDMELISLFWMPIEFVGDYNTQKLSLKLIVKILSYLNEEQRHTRIKEIKTSSEITSLLLTLTANDADFEKISRELLNNFNMKTTKNCAVFSVYCRSALFGCYELFKPKDVDRFWIDFNYTTKSVSLLCEVKLKDDVHERISIQIKIDKLQIENQFDCIVLSANPATFSKTVSTELNNARIAVFTLSQTEVQRLMANKDLVDFYNKTSNYLSSDLMAPSSQSTINNFLAEEQEEEGSNIYPLEESQQVMADPAEMFILEPSYEDPNLRRQTKEAQSQDRGNDKSNTKTDSVATVIKNSTVSSRDASKKKESGYNSLSIQDSMIFKVPTNPVPQRAPVNAPSKSTRQNIEAPKKRKKSNRRSRATLKSQHTDTQPNQSSKAAKRFFKGSVSKPAELPRTQPMTKPRKKPASNRNSGVSPKRKQVNTVKPLNHLTQPNCDPEEAALEYVENGGYANIVNFIQSSAGLASFNDQQRQQILENVERINEDLDRSSRHFFPKALSSGTDSDADGAGESKSHPKRRGTLKTTESNKFVPYSTWKVQQKQKSTASTSKPQERQTTPALVKCKVTLSAFDLLKACNEKDVSPSHLTPRESNEFSSSSDSSGSNHNFLIVESDNEKEGSDMEISPADMECRHEPHDMELSLIPTPTHTAHAEDTSPISLSSSISRVAETTSCEPNSQQILHDLAKDWASDYQPSEIFEDLEELPSHKEPDGDIHENRTEYSSEAECSENFEDLQREEPLTKPFQCESDKSNAIQEVTVHSSKSSQSENNATIITPRVNSNWYIEKYFNDQQLFNQSPINVPAALVSSPPDPQPNVMSTNHVIIQNQIVVSSARKRPNTPHDEAPFSKLSLTVDRVPFRGYAKLLPEYKKKMTAEKNRLLDQLEREHQDNYFENITQIADEILKTMSEYETEINEIQEQLSFCLGKLEWLIENQQKKRSQLEGICSDLIQRIKSSIPKKLEISRAYEAAEGELTSFATSTSSQLWQGFANNIVSTIESRLRDLVNF